MTARDHRIRHTVRDENGDPITPSHVLPLPETRHDPDDNRTFIQVATEWSAQIKAEQDARHEETP